MTVSLVTTFDNLDNWPVPARVQPICALGPGVYTVKWNTDNRDLVCDVGLAMTRLARLDFNNRTFAYPSTLAPSYFWTMVQKSDESFSYSPSHRSVTDGSTSTTYICEYKGLIEHTSVDLGNNSVELIFKESFLRAPQALAVAGRDIHTLCTEYIQHGAFYGACGSPIINGAHLVVGQNCSGAQLGAQNNDPQKRTWNVTFTFVDASGVCTPVTSAPTLPPFNANDQTTVAYWNCCSQQTQPAPPATCNWQMQITSMTQAV